MKKIIPWLHDSAFIPPLSPACRMCAKGSKMVVLVTGLCSAKCYYCPLSFKKGGTDRIFADEWELANEKEIKILVREAELIEATGAGITGGDPLVVWERTRHYIRFLKETFGDDFHIHLYTSAGKNARHLPDLVAVGLDEIRFHPLPHTWGDMERSPIKKFMEAAVDSQADVAIEIPVIPKMEKEILSLLRWADQHGIQWVNLNELEFSERNCEAFITRGYTVTNDVSAAVRGSQQSAVKILRLVQNNDLSIGVHYCSVSFKDGVQLRNRLTRRARNIARPYDVITKDATLIKGVVFPTDSSLRKLAKSLQKIYNIPNHLIFIDNEKNRVEVAAWLLEKHAKRLAKQGYQCYLVEEYPTADRLEVERTPLGTM